MPRMPLSGVRISCDTRARNRLLARFAASALLAFPFAVRERLDPLL